MSEYIQVTTATETRNDAQRIARALVERRVAACAQVIGPVASTYWWEGKVVEAEEWLCLAKSRADRFPAAEQTIRDLHPYEVPEILAVPVAAGSEPYLRWLEEESSGA